jgi:hypothetical protein
MGHAFCGRGTMRGSLRTDSEGFGVGRSLTEIFRNVPGFSWLQSANAAWPVITASLVCAARGSVDIKRMSASSVVFIETLS